MDDIYSQYNPAHVRVKYLLYICRDTLDRERYDDARKSCNRIVNSTGQVNSTYNKYAKETLRLSSKK